MNRVVFVSLTILCLLSVSSMMGLIRVVKADGGTVTINADGSISPSTAPISTADNITYTLTGNLSYPTYNGIVVERNNTVIDGNGYTAQGNQSGNGLFLAATNNVTIKNTNIENFQYGIYLSDSNNNVINENIATANSYGGIILDSSSNNIVIGNTVTANSLVGIELDYSSNSVITGNIATANNYCGIDISYYSNNNTVSGNDASANHYSGFNLYSSSSNNTVNGNNATANSWFGIYLYDSSNNSIYHNDFMNNKLSQADSINSTNTWNDGYPSAGNYWSDYNGTDMYCGAHQNQTGSDGIGDTPYVIDANNTDNYPLMAPYVPFDNQTIYINADGSVEPSGAQILRNGDLYTLTGNITSDANGIVIERDNIVLNGAGYAVTGNGSGFGITLTNMSNITVRNVTITNFAHGIYLNSSSSNAFSGNTITNNGDGIQLQFSSDNNTLSGNNVANNDFGIYLDSPSNCTVSGNNVTANIFYGIWLYSSSGNTLSCNNVTANIGVIGIYLTYSSDNNTLSGNNVTANKGYGIYLAGSSGNTLSGNNFTANNIDGIDIVDSSSNCTVSGNNVASNSRDGIYLDSCSNSILSGNNVTANSIDGIVLFASSDNTLCRNNFINNTSQFFSYGSINFWDNGSVGNYWSDYQTKYPNATQVDSSGVWNTPYVIDANNTDYYPLTVPYATIPEFPSFLILPLFMIATLLAVIIYKKKGVKTKN